MPTQPQTIDFSFDPKRDIVTAVPRWVVQTHDDCERWYRQWADGLGKYGRKMDVVIVLDDFEVDPKIAPEWGQYRARMINTFTRFSYRVHSAWAVRIFVLTSGTRYSAETAEAPTVEAAVRAIELARREASVG